MCLVSEEILQYNRDFHLIYIHNTHHRQANADTYIIKQTTRTSTRTAHITTLCFYHSDVLQSCGYVQINKLDSITSLPAFQRTQSTFLLEFSITNSLLIQLGYSLKHHALIAIYHCRTIYSVQFTQLLVKPQFCPFYLLYFQHVTVVYGLFKKKKNKTP